MPESFYDLSAESLQGKTVTFEQYRGKIVLVVNTASKCGLTPQYKGLEALYQRHKKEGLVILGFPCNQFGQQEPGDSAQIAEVCILNFGVTFPMFARINVNGSETHPVFRYLKAALPGLFGERIMWNFTKFLIGPDGSPRKRFSPITTPERIGRYLKKVLPAR